MLNESVAFGALANAMNLILGKLTPDSATVPVLVADIENSTVRACTPRPLNDGTGLHLFVCGNPMLPVDVDFHTVHTQGFHLNTGAEGFHCFLFPPTKLTFASLYVCILSIVSALLHSYTHTLIHRHRLSTLCIFSFTFGLCVVVCVLVSDNGCLWKDLM